MVSVCYFLQVMCFQISKVKVADKWELRCVFKSLWQLPAIIILTFFNFSVFPNQLGEFSHDFPFLPHYSQACRAGASAWGCRRQCPSWTPPHARDVSFRYSYRQPRFTQAKKVFFSSAGLGCSPSVSWAAPQLPQAYSALAGFKSKFRDCCHSVSTAQHEAESPFCAFGHSRCTTLPQRLST